MADFIDDIKTALDEKKRMEREREERDKHAEDKPPMNRLTCPSCETVFPIRWNGDGPDTIEVCSCLSGGIYSISVQCPKCGYKEEVY